MSWDGLRLEAGVDTNVVVNIMSSTPPPPRACDDNLRCGEVIDLVSNKAADDDDPALAGAPTSSHEQVSCQVSSMFGGVGLRDIELGDRLGARRDGGQGFQVGSSEIVNFIKCNGITGDVLCIFCCPVHSVVPHSVEHPLLNPYKTLMF